MKYTKFVVIMTLSAVLLSGCGGSRSAGDCYSDGIDNFKAKKYEQASKDFQEAIKKNEEKASYYIDYGMTLIQLKKYDDAIVQFDKVIMDKENQITDENNKRAYRGKGIAYYESNKIDKAIINFKKAHEISYLKDLNEDILLYLSSCYQRSGDYASAIASYSDLITCDKSNATYYAKRAGAEALNNQDDKAVADYNKAIELDSNNYDIYFGKYFMLLQKGKADQAKDVLTKALTIKAEKADLLNIAKIHFYQGDYKSAKKDLKTVASKKPEAYFYLGEINRKDDKLDEAMKNYQKYIDKASKVTNSAVFNQLALCYINTGDYDKAYELIEQGIEYNDAATLKLLQYNEVICLEHLGKMQEAYDKATAFESNYQDDSLKDEIEFMKTRLGE